MVSLLQLDSSPSLCQAEGAHSCHRRMHPTLPGCCWSCFFLRPPPSLSTTLRSFLGQYALPQRAYIGPTSMDPELAFLMTNMAQVCGSPRACDSSPHSSLVCMVQLRCRLCLVDMLSQLRCTAAVCTFSLPVSCLFLGCWFACKLAVVVVLLVMFWGMMWGSLVAVVIVSLPGQRKSALLLETRCMLHRSI